MEDNYYPNIVLLRYDHRTEMYPVDSALLGEGYPANTRWSGTALPFTVC